jgi:hypothetical protein
LWDSCTASCTIFSCGRAGEGCSSTIRTLTWATCECLFGRETLPLDLETNVPLFDSIHDVVERQPEQQINVWMHASCIDTYIVPPVSVPFRAWNGTAMTEYFLLPTRKCGWSVRFWWMDRSGDGTGRRVIQ